MKKTLFLSFIFLCITSLSLKAQNNSGINCKMTVNEILLQQPFDIDDPKSEDVKNIATALINELNLVYERVNNSEMSEELNLNIKKIGELVKSAIDLGMNYTMFKSDLKFLETLK